MIEAKPRLTIFYQEEQCLAGKSEFQDYVEGIIYLCPVYTCESDQPFPSKLDASMRLMVCFFDNGKLGCPVGTVLVGFPAVFQQFHFEVSFLRSSSFIVTSVLRTCEARSGLGSVLAIFQTRTRKKELQENCWNGTDSGEPRTFSNSFPTVNYLR